MVAILSDPLADRARRDAPRRALIDRTAGYRVSWFDLDALATTWARRLRASGLRAGERVAIHEPAGIRFAALLHGCLRAGAAAVPISTRAPAPEVARILSDARPRLLVRDGEVESLPEPVPGDPGDACVLYTSGTTGAPKGVRLTLANQAASARGCAESLGAGTGDRWLLCLSPHHVGGMAILFRSVLSNQPVISLARFEEAAVLAAIEDEHATLISLVPTMLIRLLEAGGLETLRKLRTILVGGAPAPGSAVREWAAMGLAVSPTYGLTETSSQVATVPPGRAGELSGSAGFPHSGAVVEIVDGEVVIAGPVVSPGYLQPAAGPGFREGRFFTGDAGRLDAAGALWITGRRDDAIITGGENVQPEEVEAVLRDHPAVSDAAVLGRASATWGQMVEARVVAAGVGVPELEAWCRERLAPFKVPRVIELVAEVPRSEGGKLLRSRLR